MEKEEQFLQAISTDLESLRTKLNERLDVIQSQLDSLRKMRDASPQHQNLYVLADRIDSARVHIFVANEYLKGNGESAYLASEEKNPEYAEILGA